MSDVTLTNKQLWDINRALGYIEGVLDTDDGLSPNASENVMEAIRAIYSILDKAEAET